MVPQLNIFQDLAHYKKNIFATQSKIYKKNLIALSIQKSHLKPPGLLNNKAYQRAKHDTSKSPVQKYLKCQIHRTKVS